MTTEIKPGDRVSIPRFVRGYERGCYPARVIGWTQRGKLKVKADNDGSVKVVSPEHVKKRADGPKEQ